MDRTLARLACERVIPCVQGDARFALLTNGDWQQGFGTTCGYLPMFAMWALGVRDPVILNRRDDAWGLRYTPGDNISRLVAGAKTLGAYRSILTSSPQIGDPLYFSNGTPHSEHVACFRESYTLGGAEHWRTYDAGELGPGGSQAGAFIDRRRLNATTFQFIAGPRTLQGFVDLDALSYASTPSDLIEPSDGGLLSGGDSGGVDTTALATLGLLFLAGYLYETGRV